MIARNVKNKLWTDVARGIERLWNTFKVKTMSELQKYPTVVQQFYKLINLGVAG